MKLFLVLFFAALANIFSQQTGVWQNYSSMYNVKDAVKTSEGIWAATEGGAFYFSYADSSFLQLYKTDGLSSLQLTALEIDINGKIWFGTKEGYINIYNSSDGSMSRLLEIFNSDKSQKQINDFFIDGTYLLTAMDFGASLINTEKIIFSESFLKFGSFPVETPVNEIKKIGVIYASLNTGVAVQKEGAINLSSPDSWNSYPLPSENLRANTTVLFNNEILAGTNAGILKLTDTGWEEFLLNNEILDLEIINNKLYILQNNSLSSYDGSSLNTIISPMNVSFNNINYIDENSFVIATSSGALNYENGTIEMFAPNGPAANSFYDLAVDNEGVVWVGTGKDFTGKGVYSFNGERWTIHNTGNTSEFLSNAFNSVYVAPDNAKYFANWGRGFTSFADGNFTTYFGEGTGLTGIPTDTNFVVITDIKADSKGDIWLLNHNSADLEPLSLFTAEGNFHHFKLGGNIRQREILANRTLAIDPYGTKWFNIDPNDPENSGVFYFNENGTPDNPEDDIWGNLRETDGLNSSIVNDIQVDNRGELWIATTSGLNVIPEPSQFGDRVNSPISSLNQQNATALSIDPLNRKWVGTGNGVFLMSPDLTSIIEHYTTKNSPVPGDIITSLTFDEKSGTIYIGTDFGMASLTTAAVKPATEFEEIFVYPNPFYINSGGNNNATIDGLIKDSEIKILSINGNLIRTIISPGGRIALWDGRDNDGDLVSTGVYLLVAYDAEADNVTTSKIAVIRK